MMRYAERLGILIGNWTWIKIVFLRNVGHLVLNRQTSLAYCALQMTSSSHWFVRRRHLIHRWLAKKWFRDWLCRRQVGVSFLAIHLSIHCYWFIVCLLLLKDDLACPPKTCSHRNITIRWHPISSSSRAAARNSRREPAALKLKTCWRLPSRSQLIVAPLKRHANQVRRARLHHLPPLTPSWHHHVN